MMRIRIAISLVGLLIAVLAVARDDKRLTWAAIAVLAVALALRFVNRPSNTAAEEESAPR